ncbi:hypothetical protein [Hyphomonas johnsonii]|jgi:hypothetical protein|uniref:Uncharacterized protein n=1 Tax=Hyphomonas johnsonii MHS-2 TaxID=1280950 RepID=A0A059F929_9PROT|nr:hypothetical protein [Hyphomonas johnsonii]KCZ87124.1 hypothetical protein HJO_17159 [Hyphomonas johnsonii MHS-2]
MGAPMTLLPAYPKGRAAVQTPLLGYLAGPHAGRIAAAWPAPHAGFLTLPAARRHAAAILLGDGAGVRSADIVRLVERGRDRDVAHLLVSGEAPGGLMKALGRLGEVLWKAGDYARFLALFSEDEAGRVLRHMPVIAADRLQLIGVLPAALRQAGIISHLPSDPLAVEDLAEAFGLALRIHGAGAAASIAQRWNRASDMPGLFQMAADALEPVQFGQVLPVPRLPEAFVPVADSKSLVRVALDFRNCLRDFAGDLAAGRMAVFTLREGMEPVAIALRQDPAGWRLAEVKARQNEDVSDEALRRIIAALRPAGVRTGESTWVLARRLCGHEYERSGASDPLEWPTWRDRIALGSLWD